MKITAGPASVINARATKLAIKEESKPMERYAKSNLPMIPAREPPVAGPGQQAVAHCGSVGHPLDGWRCMPACGVCCRLAPNERPEAPAVLDDEA